MKATGMIRSVDDLGRICLPKEMRKALKMNEGTQLELFSGNDGTLVLKRFDNTESLQKYGMLVANALSQALLLPCFITNQEKTIAASNSHFLDAPLPDLSQRKSVYAGGVFTVPLLINSDLLGSLNIIEANLTDAQKKAAEFAAFVLASLV